MVNKVSKLKYYSFEEIPPTSLFERSSLYSIEPLGVGTYLIESLSSYLSRLAKLHNVKINLLTTNVLGNYFQKEYLKNINNFGQIIKSINSYGTTTTDIVSSIERATGRANLNNLTLLSLSGVLRAKSIKDKKAWCPLCLEVFKENGNVYEPLIWYINLIIYCPIHDIKLVEFCPQCGYQQAFITSNTLPGHCFKCNKWLGDMNKKNYEILACKLPFHTLWNQWVNTNFSSLINHMQIVNYFPLQFLISSKLRQLLKLYSFTFENELADLFGLSRSTVYAWFCGQKYPPIIYLLSFLFVIDVDIVSFLYRDKIDKNIVIYSERVQYIRENIIKQNTSKEVNRINKQELRKRLEDALKYEPPINLKEFCNKYNYNQSNIRKYFPKLCKDLSQRYMTYKKFGKQQKIKLACAEIKQKMIELHDKGVYPSQVRVERELNDFTGIFYPEVRQVHKEILRQLGYRN